MNEFITPLRMASSSQALHVGYEQCGLLIPHQPIPWCADAVVVEALVRLPQHARNKDDFSLRLAGASPYVAESLRREEAGDSHRLFFRLPVPAASADAELFWRAHRIGKVHLQCCTEAGFIADLRLHLPTVFLQLGRRMIPAHTYVSTQCQSMHATAIVRSPVPLTPLAELPFQVVLRPETTGEPEVFPVALVTAQLTSRETLLSVPLPRSLRRSGAWTIQWRIGDHVLSSQRLRAITPRQFHESLRVADTRFVIETLDGRFQVVRQLPPTNGFRKAGPCFLVCSREKGMVAEVELSIVARVPGAIAPPAVLEQSVLVTEGLTAVAPGLLDANELGQVTCFELRRKRQILGTLPLGSAPSAVLDAEGAFRDEPDFAWSQMAEDELLSRLSRLMNRDDGGTS